MKKEMSPHLSSRKISLGGGGASFPVTTPRQQDIGSRGLAWVGAKLCPSNKSLKSILEGQRDFSQELHSAGGNRHPNLGGAPGEMRLAMAPWWWGENRGSRGYREYLISLSSCSGRYFGDGKEWKVQR